MATKTQPAPTKTPTRFTLSASSLTGNHVKNTAGEDLGSVKDLMIDLTNGHVAYAVLSFGGFLGFGNKLFAVPFSALRIDSSDHTFVLNVDQEKLEESHGFDPDDWPDMSDESWARGVHEHYDVSPYWN
jgi:sporulation protein YlmC with PRC-barrel domain